ncbi:MAG: hypothetical protein COC19_08395 [SAR86 cluster bacterium]|uniref:Beta-lactamase-related domain-containing protein n=1 Tax=SAR86 cluster bacterium TaxID=2030880 RepID=A0A2A4MF51_9GAMM|nr:MAG: hypothetical protein COC19_08395 [SAR86 cluster bacterium]
MRNSSLKRKFCLAALAMSVSLSTFAAPPENSISMIDSTKLGIDAAEIQAMVSKMQAAVEQDFVSGSILLIGNDEGIAVLETVGTQGPNDNTAMDVETLFRIYSMTKPIISVAIMDQIEDGLIALSDPVSKYIPEFAQMQVIDEDSGDTTPAKVTMTIEHLLTHESGLILEIFDPQSKLGQLYLNSGRNSATSPFPDMTALELAQTLGKLPLRFEPGTKWHYSRSTDVLGAILEIVDHKSLDLVLADRIFTPLGMNDTSFYIPKSQAGRIAEPIHGEMSDNTIVMPLLSGGGGLNSTTEDYVRFANMLLNGGIYHGTRIIDESTLTAMTEKFIGDDVSREYFFYGERGDWGLGFNLQPVNGNDANGPHNFGWQGVGGTLFLVDPSNEFFLIYMAQTRSGPRGSPFDLNVAQRDVYSAMRN